MPAVKFEKNHPGCLIFYGQPGLWRCKLLEKRHENFCTPEHRRNATPKTTEEKSLVTREISATIPLSHRGSIDHVVWWMQQDLIPGIEAG